MSEDTLSASSPAELSYEEAHMRLRSGPRTYTAEQAEFIDAHVRARQPLPEPPLPIQSH